MNWTAEYPTKPGYYWVRDLRLNHRTHVGEARIVLISPWLNFYEFGHGRKFTEADVVSAEWQGPIQPEPERVPDPDLEANLKAIQVRYGNDLGVFLRDAQADALKTKGIPSIVCKDCHKPSRSLISWNVGEANGRQLFAIICRPCWIARLTPEQRKVYMVE